MNRSVGFICLILLGFTATVILAQTTTRRPTTARAGATTARAGATTARAGATTARAGATTTRAGATTARAGATTARAGATTTRAGATTTRAGTTTTHAGAGSSPAAGVTTATTAAGATTATTAAGATTATTAAGGSTASTGSTTTSHSTVSGVTPSNVTTTPYTGSTTTPISTTTVSTPSTTSGGTVAASISCPPLRPTNVNLNQIAGEWYIQAYTGPPGGGPLTTTCDTFFISIDPTGHTGSILYTYNEIPSGAPGSEVASINALTRSGQFYYNVPGEEISMTATILAFQSGSSYVHVACPTNGGQATVVIGTKTASVSPSVVSSLIQQATASGAPMSDILTVARPGGC